jgi:hypothetical protein
LLFKSVVLQPPNSTGDLRYAGASKWTLKFRLHAGPSFEVFTSVKGYGAKTLEEKSCCCVGRK